MHSLPFPHVCVLYLFSDHFWVIAVSLVCGTECAFRLAYLPHFAKQDHDWGYLDITKLSIILLWSVEKFIPRLIAMYLGINFIMVQLFGCNLIEKSAPLIHWYLYLFLQYHEGVRAMWLAEKGGQIYSHPYDLGAYQNLSTVFPYSYPFAHQSICVLLLS